MKLATIKRYLYVKNYSKPILLVILFFIFFGFISKAQKYQLTFENVPLSEALLRASNEFNIKVAFDAKKLSSVFIHGKIISNTVDGLIDSLLLNSGFDFQFKHDSYLILDKEIHSIKTVQHEFQFTGSVLDKETNEQLPFATVKLIDQDYFTSASSNGSFYIKHFVTFPVHLNVSYIGYYPKDTTVYCSNCPLNFEFKLNRKIQVLDTVEVKGDKVEMVDFRNDVDFATTINPSKLIDLPILAETDIFKALQLLPGIAYTENSSELSIRGGSSDQNLVLYDGQTLYNLSHYFGVFSALNPNIIKDIQVYKGGYDSRFGERVSGIIDITGKTGNQLKPLFYGDINLLSVNLAAEVPLGDKLTLVVAGRRSYSDVYKTGFAKNLFKESSNAFSNDPSNVVTYTTPTFNFYDYNTKLTYHINNKENISLSYYGGKDHFNNSYTAVSNSLNAAVKDVNTWDNYGISASWLKQWNSAFFTNVLLGASGYSNTYSDSTTIEQTPPSAPNEKYLPNTINVFTVDDKNTLSDLSLSLRNTLYLNDNQFNFGLTTRKNNVYYHKDAGTVYVYDNTNQTAWTSSIYGLDRIPLTHNLTLKPGFRVSLYNGTHQFYFEPRLAANYRFSDHFSARVATGRYFQFLSQVLTQQETGYIKNFWVLANDSVHPAIKSNHYIVGSTFEAGNFLFDAEIYYKYYSGLQEYLYISPYLKNSDFSNYFTQKKQNRLGYPIIQEKITELKPSYFAKGKGKSYGFDFSVKYRVKSFTSWVSYSLSRSIRQFPMINDNKEFPAPTDQIHQLSWANMFSFRKWNFGTITLFNTGRPYVDYSVNDQNIPTTYTFKRLPNYFRSDFSINYNFNIKNVRLKTGVTIINIFNRNNYYDVSTKKFDFDNTSFAETNVIRAQDLSLNLFIHFVL
jgi:ferric enterobactin receptor